MKRLKRVGVAALVLSGLVVGAAAQGENQAPSNDKLWGVETVAKHPTLSHGVPNSDDIDFWSECIPKSERMKIDLTETVPWLKVDGSVAVTLSAGHFTGRYIARGELNEELGANMPVFTLRAGDPLWAALARGKRLHVGVGGEVTYEVALEGAEAPTRAFISACRRPRRAS